MNYSKLTVPVLKKKLIEAGVEIPPKSVKADLIKLLEEADEPVDGENNEIVDKKRKLDDSSEVEDEPVKKSRRIATKEKEKEKQSKEFGLWKQLDTSLLYLSPEELLKTDKIAAFDMDDTLIKTKSGKTFATSAQDWQFLFDCVPAKLKQLYEEEEFRIVIFTNQNGINGKNGWDSTKASWIKKKIGDISKELNIPLEAYAAPSDDKFRKPGTAMFDFMEENFGKVDREKSIYVGDAAGRPVNWKPGKKKDFSCSDRKFALNLGLPFATPEAFFLGEEEAKYDLQTVESLYDAAQEEIIDGGVDSIVGKEQEIVIFCGFPASGKSTFAQKWLVPNGYVWVNRDTLKTPDRCIKATSQAVAEGKSVVVDNTNPDVESRSRYIKIAKDNKIPCRCFWFQVDFDLANHLNYFRERTGGVKHVPRIGYNMYKKKYCDPKLGEGISEIKKVYFVPSFESEELKKQFELVA